MVTRLEDLPRRQTITENVDDLYTRIKDVYITMRDGVELCVNVFLPLATSRLGAKVPVLCSLGPYGKDVPVSLLGLPKTDIYMKMMSKIEQGPDACFELVDPAVWTHKFGYAIVRADTRGSGGSYGRLDPFGLERSLKLGADAEGQDVHDLVEWAGTQPWSSGKVGLTGISYYGMVCYWGAMQKPKHLKAIVPYEGATDMFNLTVRMGGIGNPPFQSHWYSNLCVMAQRGRQEGLSEEELKKNRVDFVKLIYEHEFADDGVWQVLKKCRNLADIEVPVYSAGNWTDPEIHLPGNIDAFLNVSSKHRWLEMHAGNHLAAFYEPKHIESQRKFLDYFLLDKHDSGIVEVPRIMLTTIQGDNVQSYRAEESFPPTDAESISLYITPDRALSFTKPTGEPKKIGYEGLTGQIEFESQPFTENFEILGCPYLELTIATEADDMDIFCYMRSKKLTAKELVIFRGNHDEPINNFCRTWLRLSHRESAEKLFAMKIPYVQNESPAPVEKGKFYTVIVPFMPTSYVFEPGFKLNLEIGACGTAEALPIMRHAGGDRTPERFGGKNFILSGSKLVLPRVKRA
ncbi:Alpha/Beta hydrolase protein [Cadophora sp. MPI-SDFR-AT-0126]|nr:Alpha/Beta hydrolase protein [Leotiomycetes sp. MPI-SDFR-AT-0126]